MMFEHQQWTDTRAKQLRPLTADRISQPTNQNATKLNTSVGKDARYQVPTYWLRISHGRLLGNLNQRNREVINSGSDFFGKAFALFVALTSTGSPKEKWQFFHQRQICFQIPRRVNLCFWWGTSSYFSHDADNVPSMSTRREAPPGPQSEYQRFLVWTRGWHRI